MKQRYFIFFGFLLFTVCVNSVYSQTSATLAGRVSDERRAAVVGAAVEAVNVATNNVLTATTNDDGRYVFSELSPGVYRVSVRQTGFQTTVRETVVLNVASRATQNFTLQVGEVSATVTVESGQELIERDSPTVSTVITREFVENIPLNGRSFQSLLELTPGVVLTPSGATNPGQFSVNGQRTNSNYFTLDGVSANAGTTPIATSSQQAAGTLPNTTVLGGFNNLASVDELQEFRVQTSVFAPEFGRTPGAQVSLISRAGGNRLTGSVFNYIRNEKFDANSFFNNRGGDRAAFCARTISVLRSVDPYIFRVSGKERRFYTTGATRLSSLFRMKGCVCVSRFFAARTCLRFLPEIAPPNSV